MDLYRYLCFLTHDPVQAEDLLSETFVRVIKRLPTFRGECEVKTWLFGIARNIWLESLRKRRPTVSADDPMAGHDKRDRIAVHRSPDGACGYPTPVRTFQLQSTCESAV